MIRVTVRDLDSSLRASVRELKRDPSRCIQARRQVEAALEGGNSYYGINTGFGALANERIELDKIRQLQKNLILSHAVGVGEPIPREICSLMLPLKIHALGLGFSGVSLETLQRLIEFWERDLIPFVPSKGSLGASGDLIPLAHMALPLLGLGYFWDESGREAVPAADILSRHQIQPLELQAKDGLSLINGTQMMTAYAAWVLQKCLHLVKVADVLAGMSLEALQGSIKPFDARIQQVRPHKGQQIVASNIGLLLVESEILEAHRHCGKIQDPYCLRCVPQVHGASRDALEYVTQVVDTEMNSATDNPLVFDNGEILSGGNFHGQPLALALDFAAIALAELASISERRTYLLLEGHDGLPRLLMRETGINSGFMIPQYTAAALVSENKVLCHPASVDSIPTSLGQEDHQSMGGISALKLHQVYANVESVLAIELLTAAQALDYRQPLRPGRGIECAHRWVRSTIAHTEVDRFFKQDITRCRSALQQPEFLAAVEESVGELG